MYGTYTDTAIIGAGPYGLSVAAHLRKRGLDYKIFGRAMGLWRTQMPIGMFLKSEGCASNLPDPDGRYTLARFCAESGSPYGDWGVPVSLSVFTAYGLWFQRHLVPDLDERLVVSCRKEDDLFHLNLQDGTPIRARRVVVATGYCGAARMPQELVGLPEELASHSAAHRDLSKYRGRDVIVIGAGQSALESAALLHESGAAVRLVARRKALAWGELPGGQATLPGRVLRPKSPLGAGMRNWFYTRSRLPFYHLPRAVRHHEVRTALGPFGAWWLRDRVAGRVPVLLGHYLRAAACPTESRIAVHLENDERGRLTLSADHVIAGTGYAIRPETFGFLAGELQNALRYDCHAPVLSKYFESSISGLHFIGLASALQFGPVMRFVVGAEYSVPRLVEYIARSGRQKRHAAAAQLRPERVARDRAAH